MQPMLAPPSAPPAQANAHDDVLEQPQLFGSEQVPESPTETHGEPGAPASSSGTTVGPESFASG